MMRKINDQRKGPASNYGCPVIDEKIVERVNKAAQNVFFATEATSDKLNHSLN